MLVHQEAQKCNVHAFELPQTLHCVENNEGIECFMESISLQINLA